MIPAHHRCDLFQSGCLTSCAGLKHIVFLGTGAGSFIDLQAAERAGIKVSTIGVWRHGGGGTPWAWCSRGQQIAVMHKVLRDGGWRSYGA
jgi:hypothetical protein